jgi:DNA-binding transcriptional MocR family regulator
MYLVAWLKGDLDDRKAAAAAEADVDAVPLSNFATLPMKRSGLVLGFSCYHASRIRLAVRHLAEALKLLKR